MQQKKKKKPALKLIKSDVEKPRLYKKKKQKLPLAHYQQLHKLLSEIHRFSFRATKNFTPQQKASITRTYQKNYKLFKAIEVAAHNRKPYYFIPADRKTIRRYSSKFKTTNKGILLPGPYDQIEIPKSRKKAVDMARRYSNLVPLKEGAIDKKLLEQLSQRSLIFTRYKDYHSIFIPLHKGELLPDLVDKVWRAFNPNYVNMAVAGHRANQSMDKGSWEKYQETIVYLHDKADENGDAGDSIFNGVWAVWYI